MPSSSIRAFATALYGRRTFNGIGAAKSEDGAVARAKFVALGVPAEVIVVVENQDARLVASGLAEKMRRGESADASADNHQIVGLASVHGLGSIVPEGAVAEFVHGFEGPGMTSAQAGLAGRIVTGDALRGNVLPFQIGGCRRPHFSRDDAMNYAVNGGRSRGQCDSV